MAPTPDCASFSVDEEDRRLDAVWAELTTRGAPYEVAEVQVRGQTLRAFVQGPRTITDVWASTAAFAERDYMIFGEERITYQQAHVAVDAAAAWMACEGVGPGDRVAIAMRNYPEWLLSYWACLRIGAVPVGINAWWVAAELEFALDDAAVKVVVCDAERRDRLTAWIARTPDAKVVIVRSPVTHGEVSWKTLVTGRATSPAHDADPDDDACIFYTSGTTGTPKGARLTHRGCVNTLLCIAFATDLARLSSAAPATSEPPKPPVALVTTPLFHVTANNSLAQPVTAVGGSLVLMYKWEPAEALRLIEAERVTVMSGVPIMSRELLAHPDADRRDLSSLITLNGGGAQVPPDLVSKIAGRSGAMQPGTGFGMTETCGIVSAISGAAYLKRPTSCGRSLPTFEVQVVNDEGDVLPPFGVGELRVKGAGVIKGYWRRPEATESTIVDGWLHTGDIARLDDQGYIYIVDRKKDMVLRGGENVYCAEVEAALYRHADVVEACVFGVADERLGEEVGAAVVLRAGATVTADELRLHAAGLIAAFKAPRHLWILDAPVPRNASGKFLRHELRAMVVATMDA